MQGLAERESYVQQAAFGPVLQLDSCWVRRSVSAKRVSPAICMRSCCLHSESTSLSPADSPLAKSGSWTRQPITPPDSQTKTNFHRWLRGKRLPHSTFDIKPPKGFSPATIIRIHIFRCWMRASSFPCTRQHDPKSGASHAFVHAVNMSAERGGTGQTLSHHDAGGHGGMDNFGVFHGAGANDGMVNDHSSFTSYLSPSHTSKPPFPTASCEENTTRAAWLGWSGFAR